MTRFHSSPMKLKSLTREIFVPDIMTLTEKSFRVFFTHAKKMCLAFFTFNESLFTANQSLTSATSELIIEIAE